MNGYKEGDPLWEEADEILNEYMKLIKTIIESGVNNEKRFIIITPLAAIYSNSVNANVLFPDDSKYNTKNNKLILSVHIFTLYNFVLNIDMFYTTFTDAFREELFGDFSTLYKKYISSYHSVIICEMGTINKNNTGARIEWAKYYVKKVRKFNMSISIMG